MVGMHGGLSMSVLMFSIGWDISQIHTNYVRLLRSRLAITVYDGQHLPWQVRHLRNTHRRLTVAHIPHTFMPINLVTCIVDAHTIIAIARSK